MSANNNNPPKNVGGGPSSFGNVGNISSNLPPNPTAHLQSQTQSQSQQQMGSGFAGQYQLSQLSAAQAQALAQAHLKAQNHAQAQAQAQAQAHAQLQAQLHAQGLAINMSSSSPLMTTPGNSSAKRMLAKPSFRPPGMLPPTTTTTMSPLRNMDLAAAARKKKQKLPEKQMQERVAAILPESALYTQLLEFESRVDAALMRKKIDIQEAVKNPPSVQRTLRIYVFNTFANQTQTIPKKPNAEPPSWTLKIVGRILEDGTDPEHAGMMQRASPSYPKFSTFVKRMSIALDPRLYPDNHSIMWEGARSPMPQEGFEIKRKGDEEFLVNIRLDMNYTPEKFKLSQPLMEVLGIEVDNRPRIVAAIWHYVKARKLQCTNDPSYFNCDPPLQKVFGEERLKFTAVSQRISHHLSPPQPIHLQHKIKLSGTSPAGNACYDVSVDVPLPIQRELNALLANTEKTKEIDACDEAICSAIRKIHEHRKRRAFFLGFSQSPVEFINALVDSQSKDLKLVAGEAGRNAEKERRSDFFNQPWVEDAVIRYMNRKPAAADGPGST